MARAGPTATVRPAAVRVARNTALRATAEVVGKIASLLVFAGIARSLGRETLGDYVFSLSLVQIIYAVAGFGLDRMAMRDIARDRDALRGLFYHQMVFKLALGALGLVVADLGVLALGYPRQVVVVVAVLGAAQLLALLSCTPLAVFQAHEQMEYYFAAAVPNKVLASLFGLVALVAHTGIVGVAVANLIASVLALGLAIWLVYRHFARPHPRVRAGDWPRLVLVAGPFALQEILGQIVFRIDVVLLSLFTSNSVVGAYGAAARLLEATLFLAWSSGASVLPMFSYLGRDSLPSLDRAYRASLTFVGGMVVPVAVTLFVCAGPIVSLLYGRRYDDAVPVLRWLSFAVVAYSVGYIAGTLVLVRRPGRLTVMVTAVAAAANVLLNLVLIPTLAAVGAAVATLATEVLLTTMLMVLTRRVVPAPGWGPSAAAVALSGALMGAAMIPFAGRLAVAVPVGVVTYVVALAVVGSRLAGEDAAFVRAHLARSRPPAPTQGAAIGSIGDSLP
ncbi:MAG: hypothetical protein QOE72_1903 [Chloroflexota bacterium]|nr:hypothetical protein [Chloroflexota bacterium]